MSLLSLATNPNPPSDVHQLTPNVRTLYAYGENAEDYLAHTPLTYNHRHAPLLSWLDFSLSQAPGKNVFEIGSGNGRDAKYIKNKGYNITCSDATATFIDYLNAMGQHAISCNVLTDEIPSNWDLVLANSVISHFTIHDLDIVLEKVYNSMNPNGILALTAKQGNGEAWINEKLTARRYVHYWQPSDLTNKLRDAGYKIIAVDHDIPGGDNKNHTWIHLTAKKLVDTSLI